MSEYVLSDFDVSIFGQFVPTTAARLFWAGVTSLHSFDHPVALATRSDPTRQQIGLIGDLLMYGDLEAQANLLEAERGGAMELTLAQMPHRYPSTQRPPPGTRYNLLERFEEEDTPSDVSDYCRYAESWPGTVFFCLTPDEPAGVLPKFREAREHPQRGLLSAPEFARIAGHPNITVVAPWTR